MPCGHSRVQCSLPVSKVRRSENYMTPKRTCLVVLLFAPSGLAQALLTPSPDRTGLPRGEDAGAYNITNSFEAGYRFTQVSGDADFFRTTNNYANGLRLFGATFTAHSREGHAGIFDSFTLTAQGFGNDPYSSAIVR